MQQKLTDEVWECYKDSTDHQFETKELKLGPWTSYSMMNDPKHMAFVLGRYKFCAKMLEGKQKVVEIGCGDGFGIPIIAQSVGHLHCIDWDERNIEGCKERLHFLKNVTYECVDLNKSSLDFQADGVFSIDVLEHLDPLSEKLFMKNTCNLLKSNGILITGTPNVLANQYATEISKALHINLKSMKSLKELTLEYFEHAFMFGMNDEVLHTGYGPMCHYIWSLGVNKR